MQIKPGLIYFVREKMDDGSLSNLVKIGLVEGTRSPWERLSEHQTGNPRRLIFDSTQFVETPAVKFVERQLHQTFAKHRVSGEWFDFSDASLLEKAVSSAKDLALKMTPVIPVLERANHLERVVSKEPKLPFDESLNIYYKPLLLVKKKTSLMTSITKEIKTYFKEYVETKGKGDIEDLVTEVISYPNDVFNWQKFQTDHPALYEECQLSEEKWKRGNGFKLAERAKEADLDADFLSYLENAKERFTSATATEDLYALNDLGVELKSEISLLDYETELNSAYIKVACGLAEGIEDICSWKRQLELVRVFSVEKLIEKDKSLYAEYLNPQNPTKSIKMLGFRA